MTNYRRIYTPGASWFFTVNLFERQNNPLLTENIDAVVILPDHLHCIWTLPENNTDYSTRWNVLKGYFPRSMTKGEKLSKSRIKRRERVVWQRRFWEHMIWDENDFNRHLDYIH